MNEIRPVIDRRYSRRNRSNEFCNTLLFYRTDAPSMEDRLQLGNVAASVQISIGINDGPSGPSKRRKPVELEMAFKDEDVGNIAAQRRPRRECHTSAGCVPSRSLSSECEPNSDLSRTRQSGGLKLSESR